MDEGTRRSSAVERKRGEVESFTHRQKGVCSRSVSFDLDDENRIHNVVFVGGCRGNLKAIAKLVEGKKATEIIAVLKGNRCGLNPTSCADQFAKGLEEALEEKARKSAE